MSFWTLRLLCAAAALGLAGRVPAEHVLPLALACAAAAVAVLAAREWAARRAPGAPLPPTLA
ncbi:MAG: hypothetical protein ACK41D_00350 [Rubricoccaceae bacterium]